jgi:hypothetical protein
VVAILPQVGAFSISLWKDIPYTAAFLFLGARIVDLVRARLTDDDVLLRRVIWSIALWASIAVVLRQNGVLMVVGMMAVLVIVIRPARKQLLIAAVIPLIVLGTMKVVVYRVLDVTPSGSQPALAGFLHDIAASANADPGSFDQSDRALMETAAPFEVWRQTFAQTQCASANWQWDPRFHWAAIDGESSDFVSLWTRVAEEHPLLVARNRLCVGGIAFAPYTDRGVLYTVSRGIDDNPLGLRTAPVVSSFTSPARDVLDTLDEPGWQGIAWRAPGWIYLSYLAIGVAALRSRRWILLLPALPLLMLQLSVFPVNPSQDARYMFPGLILAVLLLPLASRRPQPNRPNTEVDRAGEGEPQPTEPERADELVST